MPTAVSAARWADFLPQVQDLGALRNSEGAFGGLAQEGGERVGQNGFDVIQGEGFALSNCHRDFPSIRECRRGG
ncbi:hypothetical protein SSCG_00812 [Streptomyces clavuligerus]|nr:hypothetical protein SSCG_00812 [Streptomyces clavuligerus]